MRNLASQESLKGKGIDDTPSACLLGPDSRLCFAPAGGGSKGDVVCRREALGAKCQAEWVWGQTEKPAQWPRSRSPRPTQNSDLPGALLSVSPCPIHLPPGEFVPNLMCIIPPPLRKLYANVCLCIKYSVTPRVGGGHRPKEATYSVVENLKTIIKSSQSFPLFFLITTCLQFL